MDRKETTCAVVVTYNRKKLLMECLDSLLKQIHPLDAIYIVDNASTDETPQLLRKKGYIKEVLNPTNEPLENENTISMLSEENRNRKVKIHYVRMHENTGGAGGFYEGVKRGYERGYDWLWLMDDDVEPHRECLANLLSVPDKMPLGENIAVTPLKVDVQGTIQQIHRGYLQKDKWRTIPLSEEIYKNEKKLIKIDYSSFVGLILHKRMVEKVGFPDKDLFIWFDDVEYCSRVINYGEIYLNKNALIIHKDKLAEEYLTDTPENIEYLWKRYYGKRNSLLLYKKFRKNRFFLFFELFYFFLRDFKNIFFHLNYKILRLKLLTLGYIHVFLGIKGKKICPAKFIAKYKKTI